MAVVLPLLILGASVLALTSCATSQQMTTTFPAEVSGPIDTALGIPTPMLDEGFHYHGDGRFTTVSGREFYWRNGRFENADGSLMEVPESVNDKLEAAGMPRVDAQPTVPTTTSS
jgi:hypothetical protein